MDVELGGFISVRDFNDGSSVACTTPPNIGRTSLRLAVNGEYKKQFYIQYN